MLLIHWQIAVIICIVVSYFVGQFTESRRSEQTYHFLNKQIEAGHIWHISNERVIKIEDASYNDPAPKEGRRT